MTRLTLAQRSTATVDAGARAFIYCRLSRNRYGDSNSVEVQERECRDLCERRGWEVVEVFVDDDRSAYSGKPRPDYERMLRAVGAGLADVVVCRHTDRLTRAPRELEDLIDALNAADVRVETVYAGPLNLATRSGRTSARLHGTMARDESEAKSERNQGTHASLALAGAWPGGVRHYGYEWHRLHRSDEGELRIVDAEAEIIREAARRVLAGEALFSIVKDLNRRQVATVKGRSWRVQTLRRILTSWTVCGRREYHGEDVGPAAWPGILDVPTRNRLDRVINDPARSRPAPARVSLLASIVRCADCDTKMITQRRANGTRVYVCPAKSRGGCGGPQVNADDVDELVAEMVVVAVDGPGLAEQLAERDDAGDDHGDLEAIEQDLEDLAADLGAGRISRREWLAARAPLVDRRDAAQAKATTDNRSAVLAPYIGQGALAEAWPNLTLDQQRAIVAAVIDRVTIRRAIKRGPVFDPDRVRVLWQA